MNAQKQYRIIFALICLGLVLALTIGSVKASPTRQVGTQFAAIDTYVTEQMKNLGIPGMALGIVQDGKIAHLQGFGFADSSGRAVTTQTPFYLGSVTKSFTALAVMQLVEAGEIELDAPVQTYLPWFELADKDASAKITVRNLLNHTSGISTEDGNRDLFNQQGLEEFVRGLGDVSLTEPVGKTFQYSNINYSVAGLIVEKVSEQPYPDYVTEHIFMPLDMRHSYTSREIALSDGLSDGHLHAFGHAFRWERPVSPAVIPEGFLIASVEDMSHYAIAQLNDGQYGDTSILSPQGIAELHTPVNPVNGVGYAMGWVADSSDVIPIIWHSGESGNFHTMVILIPQSDSAIILLANASGFEYVGSSVVDKVAQGVFSLLNDKPADSVSALIKVRFLYWTVLLTPLLMILGIVYSWRCLQNKGIGYILLMALLYGGFGLLWLLVVPSLLGTSILSVVRIQVTSFELAYGVVASAILGFGWSVVFTAMNLVRRRAI